MAHWNRNTYTKMKLLKLSITANCFAFGLVGYCIAKDQWSYAAINLCIHIPLIIWNIKQYKKQP